MLWSFATNAGSILTTNARRREGSGMLKDGKPMIPQYLDFDEVQYAATRGW
jgi:hypothetical protein